MVTRGEGSEIYSNTSPVIPTDEDCLIQPSTRNYSFPAASIAGLMWSIVARPSALRNYVALRGGSRFPFERIAFTFAISFNSDEFH